MKVLTLDFEGSLKKGIREIGGVLSEKTTITEVYDIKTDNEIEIKKYLFEILSNDIEFIVSHNIHIEKNLVKKYLPYPKKKNVFGTFDWGPWLDTKKLYSTLYPKIKNYELKNLVNVFLKKNIMELSSKYCSPSKSNFHNALYDALCTFLLYNRLSEKITLGKFIS